MQIEILRSEDNWATMAGEWNELLAESISNVPFLRHEYLWAWWQHRGGGEWPESELYLVTGRGEDGALIGIAPLFISKNLVGERALMLLGGIEISDFLDVIVREADLAVFLEAVVAHLTGPDAPEWDCLDWYNLLDNSPTLNAMAKAAEKAGLSSNQARLQASPYIQLPDDFEEYLDSLDKKYRHEIRRKLRKAAGFFIPVNRYVVEDGERLSEELDEFMMMMREESEKNEFLTEAMAAQLQAIAKAAFDNGWLQLGFLTVGKEKAAGYFNFDYDNRIWVYNSGLARKHGALSPGIVLIGELLEDAIDNGREVFDLMRGDEEYKYHLGGQDRYVMRMVVGKQNAN